jgi:hypothetical protein
MAAQWRQRHRQWRKRLMAWKQWRNVGENHVAA